MEIWYSISLPRVHRFATCAMQRRLRWTPRLSRALFVCRVPSLNSAGQNRFGNFSRMLAASPRWRSLIRPINSGTAGPPRLPQGVCCAGETSGLSIYFDLLMSCDGISHFVAQSLGKPRAAGLKIPRGWSMPRNGFVKLVRVLQSIPKGNMAADEVTCQKGWRLRSPRVLSLLFWNANNFCSFPAVTIFMMISHPRRRFDLPGRGFRSGGIKWQSGFWSFDWLAKRKKKVNFQNGFVHFRKSAAAAAADSRQGVHRRDCGKRRSKQAQTILFPTPKPTLVGRGS